VATVVTGGVVVVFALEREAAPFRRRNTGAHVFVSGVGANAARHAAHFVIDAWEPRLVVAAGFCGALAPHLAVGDVVTSPRILTVDSLVADPTEKRRLADRHGADAVDMESAAVERVCADRGVPFLAVRAVSDDVDTRLSLELVRLLSGGKVSPWKVIPTLLVKPSLLGEFRRLARDTKAAAEKLADALTRIAADFAPPAA
jgi:adenosylhomocysteine nucleosidase